MTFSHNILTNPVLNPANWFVRFADLQRTVTTVASNLGIVTVTTVGNVPNVGDNVVTYTPPPFDVISDTARPTAAPAFTDFPMHI